MKAAEILADACASSEVQGAALYVRSGSTVVSQAFGTAPSVDAAFLLGPVGVKPRGLGFDSLSQIRYKTEPFHESLQHGTGFAAAGYPRCPLPGSG